jgi:predicted Zn-dependent protease
MATDTALQLASAVSQDSAARDQIFGLLGLGARYGVLMPYGRAQEREADLVGLELMARAGFDPRGSVALWRNLSRRAGGEPPEFLSTHPSHGDRIDGLQAHMDDALARYREARSQGLAPRC